MKNASFTVRDLPLSERPRERLLQHGVDALSSQELLALILGRGIQGESVMVTSQKLLKHFGSLEGLQQASFEDLQQIRGIGRAKACQLLACFAVGHRVQSAMRQEQHIKKEKNLPSIIGLLVEKISSHTKEHFAVVSLDARQRLIGIDVIAVGTLNANLVHPREIFEAAIRRHAASIMISHNHPSGSPAPSSDDIQVTEQLVAAGKLFDIPVVDHIIIAHDSYYSILSGKIILL